MRAFMNPLMNSMRNAVLNVNSGVRLWTLAERRRGRARFIGCYQ